MEELANQFKNLGHTVDLSFREHGVVVVKNFEIQVGPHAGIKIDVGIPARDFPFTPPAGLHLRPILVPNGQNNVNPSPLGHDWQYWSRRLTEWSLDRSARHIISYINKVLING